MSRKSYLKVFFATLSLLVIFSIPKTHAQTIPIAVGGIELTASTDNPAPNQMITITARSYSIDINAAKITWTVNGKISQQGIGLTTLNIQTPALGKKLNIVVSAATTDGAYVTSSIVINSGYTDMVLEPSGYVPPFFKGKIPVAYQNSVKVVAYPHLMDPQGNEYDPKNLVYHWERNSQALESDSGYGKQSIIVVNDVVPRPYVMVVTATSRDGSLKTTGMVSINPQSPSLLFYLNDPLYGPMYNSALGDLVSIGSSKESTILAVPYGFNKPQSGLGSLSLKWLINGTEHSELSSSDSIVLRAPDNTTGSSNIDLKIQNTKDFLQEAESAFSAVYSSSNTSNSPQSSVIF